MELEQIGAERVIEGWWTFDRAIPGEDTAPKRAFPLPIFSDDFAFHRRIDSLSSEIASAKKSRAPLGPKSRWFAPWIVNFFWREAYQTGIIPEYIEWGEASPESFALEMETWLREEDFLDAVERKMKRELTKHTEAVKDGLDPDFSSDSSDLEQSIRFAELVAITAPFEVRHLRSIIDAQCTVRRAIRIGRWQARAAWEAYNREEIREGEEHARQLAAEYERKFGA